MNSKEEKQIMREVSEVFLKHNLVLEDSSQVIEKISANLLRARTERAKAAGIPINRKSRRLLKL